MHWLQQPFTGTKSVVHQVKLVCKVTGRFTLLLFRPSLEVVTPYMWTFCIDETLIE